MNEYIEQPRPESPLRDSDILKLAARIDNYNFKVGELIDRIKASNHPKGEEIAQRLLEDCIALNSAKDTVEGYLPKKV